MASDKRDETPDDSGSDSTSPAAEEGVSDAASGHVTEAAAAHTAGSGGNRPLRGRARTRELSRTRRIIARTALAVGGLVTAMGLSLIGGCFINDHTIGEATGTGVAEVVDTSPVRTAVRFNTPDGQVYIPAAGALYPSGLKTGQLVRVEYDMRNPDLVRVAGRDGTISLLPVFSALAVVWALVLPVHWLARHPRDDASAPGAMAITG